MLSDELRYQLLRTLERNPEMTQRQIAKELDLSLGKVNYCIKALLEKGLVIVKKMESKSESKPYSYKLTSKGVEEKSSTTVTLLQSKEREKEKLLRYIEELKTELGNGFSKEL